MRLLRSRWTLATLLAVIITVAAFALTGGAEAEESRLTAVVARGDFKVLVNVTGDLRAMSSIEIGPPAQAQRVGLYQMKIATLVPEGTVVKAGDVVAELDRGQLLQQLNTYQLNVQRAQAVFDQAKLDTTLNLSKARDDLRNMEVALEERRIAVEQAKYEAPSVKRQAELDAQKATRAHEQGKIDYGTREKQAQAKMREVSAILERDKQYFDMLQEIGKELVIKAPSPGMVIYVREYNGRKKGVGSMVYPHDGGGVATLPDLTRMQSATYVNEVDVRRVQVGQNVSLTLDSDPSKKLTGIVRSVANVGEERPNSDAKVFEVKIDIAESDTTLRPGMTTGNAIETAFLKDVLSVPLEAVSSEGNLPYVFVRNGRGVAKQRVETGEVNDTHVVITAGVSEGDVVLLVPPANHATIEMRELPERAAGDSARKATGKTPGGADAAPATTVPVRPGAAKAAPPKTGEAVTPPRPPGGNQ